MLLQNYSNPFRATRRRTRSRMSRGSWAGSSSGGRTRRRWKRPSGPARGKRAEQKRQSKIGTEITGGKNKKPIESERWKGNLWIAYERKCAYALDIIVSMKIRQMLILCLLTSVFRRVNMLVKYFQPTKSPVSTEPKILNTYISVYLAFKEQETEEMKILTKKAGEKNIVLYICCCMLLLSNVFTLI